MPEEKTKRRIVQLHTFKSWERNSCLWGSQEKYSSCIKFIVNMKPDSTFTGKIKKDAQKKIGHAKVVRSCELAQHCVLPFRGD